MIALHPLHKYTMEPNIHKLQSDSLTYEIMYTNERRRIPEFCDIRRQLNRDNCLPSYEIPAQISKIFLALVIIPCHEPP